MANWEALQLAVHMAQQPALVRRVRANRLPRGITELLEVASGNSEINGAASQALGLSPENTKKAATFFVEQILFHHRASSYRILGAEADTASDLLRRHMALLMKWLHPDTGARSALAQDHSALANRVTEAWENLKSEERRRDYDAKFSTPASRGTGSKRSRSSPRRPVPLGQAERSLLGRMMALWSKR